MSGELSSVQEFTELASGDRLREELRALGFSKAADGIIVIDTKGTIVVANEQVTTFFWYTQDELLGASIDLMVPEGSRVAHAQHREDYSDNPTIKSMGAGRELMARRKDGKEFRIEISLNPLPHRNEMFFMASIRRPSVK